MLLYSIDAYGSMLADTMRTDAYARALRSAIKPGCVVLDMGTGTGIWALLACQFGARKVYAVDKNNAIQLAREIAAANSCNGKIEFMQELSTRLTLPERADVVVSDMHGVLPMFEQNLVSILDARQRHLAPGGTLIPLRETLWAAVVEAPELYGHQMRPWDNSHYGLSMRAGLRIAANTWTRARVKPDRLLVAPACWATLDYAEVDNPHVCGKVNWVMPRAGTGHGLIAWFDCTLAEGVRFSNSPEAPELMFGSAYFPWPEPVQLAPGDRVRVLLQANLVGEDYIWRWNTQVLDQGRSGKLKSHFEQSTFHALPLSAAQLHKQAATYKPMRNEDGELDLLILSMMDGETPLDEIARCIQAQFPIRFPCSKDALGKVAELAVTYSP
jgi:protein arginine N-methyltransferase 1